MCLNNTLGIGIGTEILFFEDSISTSVRLINEIRR